jgi:molecular chaperone HscC
MSGETREGLRIGIDLGTTFSLAARMEGARPIVIPNALGEFLTASAVSIADDGTLLVGAAARARAATHPECTFRNFKRDMGTDREFVFGEHRFTPEKLSALVLRQLKDDVEAALHEPVVEAVITVPAYFGELQRRATQDAAEIAGLRVERLVNEPTAAALAYGLHNLDRELKVVVIDLGGGTLDVTVLEIVAGVIEVQSTAGDARLGGEDFSEMLADHLATRARDSFGVDPRSSSVLAPRFFEACERAKRRLSEAEATRVAMPLPGPHALDAGAIELDVRRAEAEAVWAPLLKRIEGPILRALRDANLAPDAVDEVLLVGGATRMPAMLELGARLFGRMPRHQLPPDEAVALGAAVQMGLKAGDAALDDVVSTDIAPYSLGVAVTSRAAKHALGDLFSPILERGTVLPASRVGVYATTMDNQTEIKLEIYQGEHSLCRDNTHLGDLAITKIPKAPAGEATIEVRFTYDLNGLLEVDVEVGGSGRKHSTLIDRSGGRMSRSDVDQARKAMARLKLHPRDALPNTVVLARAEELFVQLVGDERVLMQRVMTHFRLALEGQDPAVIEAARGDLRAVIAHLQGSR